MALFEIFPNYVWNLSVSIAMESGAQIGEVIDMCAPILDKASKGDDAGTLEFMAEWVKKADTLIVLADEDEARGRAFSASAKLQRASLYLLCAERMQGHGHPGRAETYTRARAAFEKAMVLGGENATRVEIPVEGGTMPAVLTRAPGDGAAPVVVFCNGLDSSKELLYWSKLPHALARRGISTLCVDQPGTGEPLRLQNLPATAHSEQWAAKAVDWLEGQAFVDPKRIGMTGISLGGHYVPRSVAYEPRFASGAVWGANHNWAEVQQKRLRREGENPVPHYWAHVMWVFGAKDMDDFHAKTVDMNLNGHMDRIKVPFLVTHGAQDRQIALNYAQQAYDQLTNSPKRELKIFTPREGGVEHVGADNMSFGRDYIADWFADTLGGTFRLMEAARLAIDPFDEAFLADPYAHHAALRDAGAVVWLEPLGCYAMARHGEVSAALKDWETFVSGRGVGLADFARETPYRPPSLLLEADPPLHSRTRGLMNKVVSLAALRVLRPGWQAIADQLADDLVARGSFDAVTDLAEVLPMRIFPDTIGLMDEGRAHLLTYAAAVFNAFGPRNAVFDRGNAVAAEATAWVAAACKRENLKPGGWGLAVYEAADAGNCTTEEAERLVRSFLSAGVDTTVNGIGHLMLALATHPESWAQLRERPELAGRAFEESLRWDSTVQTFFRTTSRNVRIADVTIPAESKILLFLAAANRDPLRWDRPDSYDMLRQTSGHVGFGFGIHQCLGQMVARIEGEVVLAALLPRIKTIRATGAPVRRLNNTLHALASLPVEIEPA